MAFELQAKLLRVLESGEYIKIGDTKPTKVNVRIISATNRDLKKEIEQGNFREDLYYRLSVFQIHLPPLRERQNTHYECSDDNIGSFELAAMEKHHITKVLQYTKGNKTEASRLLKIGLTTLYRKIEEYGISL